ncbi:aldo/keto reductase [Pigmentiphaga aceris]|uniref:Aldo/keto reductase n=1 Tax=Pigmentiphaga aceris TaxID=1940612 RepID=A0A5C0AU56_9BURK|nr:aldo/keto reductase [Pigmentiphaga aceris]QEI05828.1 aldo/keto reductase [Pigmentiphaga aceris]
MQRRNFLAAASAAVGALAVSSKALAQAGSSGSTLPQGLTARGSVMPTRGRIVRDSLPRNEPLAGMRYRTPFRFGLGGTQIGNIFEPISEAQAQSVLQAAWDSGVRYFDTSPFYGYGLSEYRLGQFLRTQRPGSYVVSTKVGRVLRASKGSLPNASLWPSPAPFSYTYDFSAAGTRRSVEDSLQRMGIPQIDMVFIHDLSPDNTELDRPWQEHFAVAAQGAMVELTRMREEGLIGGWGFGINTPNAAVLAATSNVPTPDIVLLACQYSLLDHADTLDKTFPALQNKGISVVIGTPLNDGFLGGRSRYHFSDQIPAGAVEKRARLMEVADRFGIDIRTAALQFAAAPPIVSAVIPGARVAAQVRANVESMKVEIPADFWAELRRLGLITAQAPVPA